MEIWTTTQTRFIAFLDILGFKDLVSRNTHEEVLSKLSTITSTIDYVSDQIFNSESIKKRSIEKDQTKVITFSDSIIILSKSDTYLDLYKILMDCHFIHAEAIEGGLAIKGALSYGRITADLKNSLYFGQPIIDAYLLQEDLQMLSIILDHNIESKINSTPDLKPLSETFIVEYKACLKSGRVRHSLLHNNISSDYDEYYDKLKQLYNSVSGRPRIYIDNTIDFVEKTKTAN